MYTSLYLYMYLKINVNIYDYTEKRTASHVDPQRPWRHNMVSYFFFRRNIILYIRVSAACKLSLFTSGLYLIIIIIINYYSHVVNQH